MSSLDVVDAGRAAIAGGLLWLGALVAEYTFDLFPPGEGGLGYHLSQAVLLFGMFLWVVALVALRQVRAAGDGRLGR
jgi:hypothetical protein